MTEHGSFPLFLDADNCEHPEPAEPDTDNDGSEEWVAYDAWCNGHPHSAGYDGERVCIDTEVGRFCPVCTEVARKKRDLPHWEYAECQVVAQVEVSADGR